MKHSKLHEIASKKKIFVSLMCLVACILTSCHDSDNHDTSSLNGTRWVNYSQSCLDGDPDIPFVDQFTLTPEVYLGTLVDIKNDGSVDVYRLNADNKIEYKILSSDLYLVRDDDYDGPLLVIDSAGWYFSIQSKDLLVREPWMVPQAFYIDPKTGELTETTAPGENYERTTAPLSSFIRTGR